MAEGIFEQIEDRVLAGAFRGLDLTIDFALAKARHYVPVRAIFRRTRMSGKARLGTASAALSADLSPAQVLTAYRRRPLNTARQFERFSQSQPPTHQITVQRIPLGQFRRLHQEDMLHQAFGLLQPGGHEATKGRSSIQRVFRGHANSEIPVARVGDVTIAGDLRLVQGGRLKPVPYLKSTHGVVKVKPPPRSGYEQFSVAEQRIYGGKNHSALLTSKGAYEVKSGRANYTRSGETRVGGRLKASLRSEKPTLSYRSGVHWGYVIAGGGNYPDGTSVTFVARMQEYGSRHNRPHPFLRPALYEARGVLRANVLSSIVRGGS